jgi:hypothetical protein
MLARCLLTVNRAPGSLALTCSLDPYARARSTTRGAHLRSPVTGAARSRFATGNDKIGHKLSWSTIRCRCFPGALQFEEPNKFDLCQGERSANGFRRWDSPVLWRDIGQTRSCRSYSTVLAERMPSLTPTMLLHDVSFKHNAAV